MRGRPWASLGSIPSSPLSGGGGGTAPAAGAPAGGSSCPPTERAVSSRGACGGRGEAHQGPGRLICLGSITWTLLERKIQHAEIQRIADQKSIGGLINQKPKMTSGLFAGSSGQGEEKDTRGWEGSLVSPRNEAWPQDVLYGFPNG